MKRPRAQSLFNADFKESDFIIPFERLCFAKKMAFVLKAQLSPNIFSKKNLETEVAVKITYS
jgi:hypothetical protein